LKHESHVTNTEKLRTTSQKTPSLQDQLVNAVYRNTPSLL
jgi:hypothetical protein